MTRATNKMISVIIPVFNEEESISPLYKKLTSVLTRIGKDYEVIFIDDGSSDDTLNLLRPICKKDPRIKFISFSRNFGQTSALSAGIDFSKGKIIIPMDGDLQNDPEDIPSLLQKIEEGYDVVITMDADGQHDPAEIPKFIEMHIIYPDSIIIGSRMHEKEKIPRSLLLPCLLRPL